MPSVPGISKKRRSPIVPPEPSTNSTLRPDISMQLWLSGMMSLAGGGVVAHGLPVVAAFSAGAYRSPLADFLLQDVGAVGQLAGLHDRYVKIF